MSPRIPLGSAPGMGLRTLYWNPARDGNLEVLPGYNRETLERIAGDATQFGWEVLALEAGKTYPGENHVWTEQEQQWFQRVVEHIPCLEFVLQSVHERQQQLREARGLGVPDPAYRPMLFAVVDFKWLFEYHSKDHWAQEPVPKAPITDPMPGWKDALAYILDRGPEVNVYTAASEVRPYTEQFPASLQLTVNGQAIYRRTTAKVLRPLSTAKAWPWTRNTRPKRPGRGGPARQIETSEFDTPRPAAIQ